MKALKHRSYTYRKGGVYYFSKAVPQDLTDFYARPRIVRSLRMSVLGDFGLLIQTCFRIL